jgi:hypothetical protein
MEDFKYKQYSDEENKIYYEAMAKIIGGLRNGLGFNEACSIVNIEDKELRGFIEDDALKIMIAEMHYKKGLPLSEVTATLKVSIETTNKANLEMLEDVGITAIDIYRLNNPDTQIGNT